MTEKHCFWSTMPGILTGLAAIITAVGGLVLVLFQTGFLGENGNEIPFKEPPIIPLTPEGSQTKRINLLSSENGGQLLVADSNYWLNTVDGKEGMFNFKADEAEAVFGFKDDRPATFNTFTTLIEGTNVYSLKKFELFVGNESPTGPFTSIGKFETQNLKIFKTPYQEFKFRPVTAKFFRVKLLSSHGGNWIGGREFQLMGYYQ